MVTRLETARQKPRCSIAFVSAIAVGVLLLADGALASRAAQRFERINGCTLEPDEWTDGDSFRVRLPDGRLETFRLYYVDTTESRSRGKRSDEQAAYFELTRAQAVELGKEAKEFTARALAKPFTIQTRWRKLLDGARFYAMVYAAEGDDLAELLVTHGLARIHGTRTPLPDGRDSRTYLAHLRTVEEQAKRQQRGGWRREHSNTKG